MKTQSRIHNLSNITNITDKIVAKHRKSAGYVAYRDFSAMKVKYYALLVTLLVISAGALTLSFVQNINLNVQAGTLRQIEQERNLLVGMADEVEALTEQISELEELFEDTQQRYMAADYNYVRAARLNEDLLFQLDTVKGVLDISESSVVADLNDLRIPSNTTEAQLNLLLEGTPLAEKGWYFLLAEREYGVNAIIMISIMRQESNIGRAGSLWRQNNFAGITNGRGGWARFETPKDGIFALARLLGEHYLSPDGRFHRGFSLDAVNILYAPLSDSRNRGWAPGIRSHTEQALQALS